MLNNKGFNLWADHYDETVQVSEETQSYPFAGYKEILNQIFNEVMQKDKSQVLDIGFGTGILASRLYDNGHQIDGIDFSSKMMEIANAKMPKARLMEWDITKGLPTEVQNKKYDAIVSSYTLHHLSDEKKIIFIKDLLKSLKDDGKLLIGDVAFQTRKELENCREEHVNDWDEDEFYFVADELQASMKFCKSSFYPLSHCGGVFVISGTQGQVTCPRE
ncbi:class I SAM-dependent methyltransferase [Virgibacillus ainsalahensis]